MDKIENQLAIAQEIDQKLINFKKDGAERKSKVDYFKNKWSELDNIWKIFQFQHDQICMEVSKTDPYFVNKTYEATKVKYEQLKTLLTGGYQRLLTPEVPTTQKEDGHMEQEHNIPAGESNVEQGGSGNQNLPSGSGSQSQAPPRAQGGAGGGSGRQPPPQHFIPSREQAGTYSKMDEVLRKQEANFRAFERTVSNIDLESITDKWEFEDSLKLLENRWSAIDHLHWEIDSELNGSNSAYEDSFSYYEHKFNTLKKAINKRMWSVSHREKSTPKLDIPVFSGSYNNWVSFKDLFIEAIHNNPTLSNAQRMQFLKSKLRGEAEKLIQHLSISSDNYQTSWEILKHRYDNQRFIFTSHMNILFGLPNIQQNNALTQIKKMHDVAVETLNAVKNLGIDISSWDPILVHILSQKLDSETYTDYLESVKSPRELPVLQELLEFLESRFTTLETSLRRKQEHSPNKNSNQNSSTNTHSQFHKKHFNNYYYNAKKPNHDQIAKSFHVSGFKCPLCKNEHGLYNCRQFLQMSNDKKLSTVNKLGVCINCLFSHFGKTCNSNKTCRKCSGQHNSIIHDALEKTPSGNRVDREPVASSSNVSQDNHSEILLATALVKVESVDGTYHVLRALIDQGSQLSLITEHAAQTLRIKRERCQGVIYGVGQRGNNSKGKMRISCKSMYNDYAFNTEVVIMSDLIKCLPNKTFPKPTWSNIQNINLADPEFYISRPVDLLLGADVYSNIMLSGIIKGDDVTQPMAQQTQLGWLLCGSAQTFQCNVVINNIEDIQKFWEVEEISEEDNLSSADQHCVQFFQETTTRNSEGRYQVRIPMEPQFEEKLGKSKQKAIAQFHNLERKLEKQTNMSNAYKEFMNEYLTLKHMKQSQGNSTPECYLPHHGVERAESTTTKYRVVFNASAKTSTGCSLNDLMYKGPNLQQDLQSLLLRWRQFQYAFTADIEKMYRQILVHPVDQTLQKIIWRESPEQPLQSFQLTTVTYGTKAAPFLAMMTLKKLAHDERHNFPEASKAVEQSFYMDDLVHGAHKLEQGKQLINDLDVLLKSGGFTLRKWSANNPDILENIVAKQQNTNNVIFNFKTENTSKTLGLCWNPLEDKFVFKYVAPKQKTSKLTKRDLLSEISKLFDPLGWLAPLVTKSKILFQKLWKTNIQWDEAVTNDIYREWCKLQADMNKINEYEIPRWLLSHEHDIIELHGFCDASLEAYACVVYARVTHRQQVVLIAAKTKLVPLNKHLTLPRLELSGAHLLSKLMKKIKDTMSDRETITYGWTDSKVVLGWLQGDVTRWKPFVSNRVRQIIEIMPENVWNYVKTTENPADAASRGLYASQLLSQQSFWKNGPKWLSTFEPENVEKKTFQTEQEIKASCVNIVQQNPYESIIGQLLQKHSNFNKILRILAWIRRALTPKRHNLPRYLTLNELRVAKMHIIQHVQNYEYANEFEQLRKNGNVASKSKLANLNPFIDKYNILRVGGRLSQTTLSPEKKHPKIIPRDSRLAALLIDQAHKLTFHGGPRLTLATLRDEYWITGGNSTVKKELRKCITCRKLERKTEHQLMGDLPAARINPAKPFHHTGVDYTGFVDVKASKGRGAKTMKGYIAIFICMVTKAIHLELVSDLTSSAFLSALRRMAARRGAPCHIYSDNGTNFVGANRALQEEFQIIQKTLTDELLAQITNMKIEWHFNAPAWPSAGGLWERAVRSLKHHLRRVVGDQKLTFEEYSTILAQIEACLNSRPLCALTENIDDVDFLTPAHFLTGRAGLTVIETEEDARTRWHLTNKLFQDIWKKWKSEYLAQLTARRKWSQPQRNVETGDLVVIHEDNLPPGKWALGRVSETHPGNDGYVRVVTLKTKNGTLTRPVTKLSVLPLNQEPDKTKPVNSVNHSAKQKGVSSFISMAMIFIYIFTFLSTGNCLQMTSLNNNQSLYFDKISQMQIIKDEWKIIAYYDMNPYWEGMAAYVKYYQHLQNLCNIVKRSSHCEIIMLQLQHLYSELEHNNRVLLHQNLDAHARQRRGLINGVGYVANTLFGVLDDRFADQYRKDIAQVRNNEKHLALLWKNQTSVVEAEYNVLKRTEEIMQRQHKLINHQMMNFEKSISVVTKHVEELEFMTEFSFSAMAATNVLNHLRNIQDTLLDTITNIYNAKINIHLMSPEQLLDELRVISGQLTKDLILPIENIQMNIQNIYKFLHVKAKVTKEYTIFEIRIPLITRDEYELYNILPIPRQQGSKMITIVPIENYVAINLRSETYLPISVLDLDHCISKDSSNILCQLKTPTYTMKADHDLCIKDENNIGQCKTYKAMCQNEWKSLTKPNQYLYFCCDKCQIRTLCNDQITSYQLTATNIIKVEENCNVKVDNFTIYTHRSLENKINISSSLEVPEIASINHALNITVTFPVENEKNELDKTTNLSLKSIGEKIKEMKRTELSLEDENINTHDVHHYASIYCLWGALVVLGVLQAGRRLRGRKRSSAIEQPHAQADPEAPAPEPPAAARSAGADYDRPDRRNIQQPNIPITWSAGARAVLPCVTALGERVQPRRPPPPLGDSRPRARPRPRLYFWTKDGQNVTSKRVSPTGALEVSRRRGGGIYQCLVRHHGGLVMGYPTNLQFAAMDKQISLSEANTTVRSGQPVLLNCNISSAPPANVSWIKDDLPLIEDDRHFFLPHQLLITDPAETDQGFYRCVATNSYVNKTRTSQPGYLQVVTEGADEDLAFLPVEVDHQILAPRGSRVVLPCPVKGWPRPKLIWQLQPPSARRGELEVEEQVLVLSSLQPDQEGNYTCAVGGRPDLNQTYSVTLTEPVTITIPPWSITALGASTVRFNCTASGRPPPTVRWYKDGLLLHTSRRINLRKSADLQRTELVISGVTSDDAGVYQCFASNPVNTASFWALLNVTGADAEPPSNVRCWPVDDRRVKITWTQPQGEVVAYTVHETPVEEKASNSVPGLPIANTKTEEIVEVASPLVPYRFQVRAYIRVNKSTASDLSEPAVCQGQGVPIRLIKLERDSVLVSWKQFAESNPGVVQWVLQTTTDREQVEQNITLDGSVYNYTLNAPPSSPVLVRVLGTRALPWLPQHLALVSWASTAAATDHLDAGDEPATPTDIEVTSRDAHSFTITWQCECVHCTYMVCVRSEMERCFESLEKSATIEELHPGSEYEVRVQARKQGRALGGAFSAPHLVTTATETPQRFRDLQAQFVNSSTLRVSWNGEPARYKVHYSAQLRVPVEEWDSVETMSNTVLIRGLDPSSKIYLMVTGYEPEEHSKVVTILPYYKDLDVNELQYAYTGSGVKVWWSASAAGPHTVSYAQNITKPVEQWAKLFVTGNWVELTVDPELPTYVMVSSSKQVMTIAPRPRPHDYSALYLGIGVSVGILLVCALVVTVILMVWRRRKQGPPPRGRRDPDPQAGGPHEDTEMKVVCYGGGGGGVPNGGARGAGEPLLNGYGPQLPLRITENPTSKTPNGKMKKGRRYEPAFDLARYEDPDTTLETVLDDSAPYSLLDTSRHPDYDPSRSSRELSANNSFPKLPDDNMNSEMTKCLDNSEIQPTLQPNG